MTQALCTHSNQADNASCRVRFIFRGIVQGVGFRPYLYRLAHTLKLSGFTFNNSQGVTLELQGCKASIDAFIDQFTCTPPPLGRIDNLERQSIDTLDAEQGFSIIKSQNNHDALVAISADKSCCQDCLDEINSVDNRHYRYPFTNCTNCGPRYTLIKALPYDRPHTSMANFAMCTRCRQAYEDPMDRRYHAQPISCPDCGPQLTFYDEKQCNLGSKQSALALAAKYLLQGKIIAIKGLGGFHLMCDATNDDAVRTLRLRKRRPKKPLAVLCQDLAMAQDLVKGNNAEWRILQSAERPITLMTKRKASSVNNRISNPGSNLEPSPISCRSLSDSVAPDIDRIGIFLPYTPLHQLLLQQVKRPLVATSANRSGEPIISSLEQIYAQLSDVIDGTLDHNRDIVNPCDDSVVQLIDNELQVIRLARGYAPLSIPFKNDELRNKPHTLAVGAQQKNSIAFAFGDAMVLSPHIGDLFSIEAEQYFTDTLATFKRLYSFSHRYLVCDHHTDYATSKWAQDHQQQAPTVQLHKVQHHHAHTLSVMAVNHHTGPCLGFTFDGTGLGDNNQLWGGEAILVDINQYQRIASLQPLSLIGNEQAIRDPRRIMLASLFSHFSKAESPLDEIANLKLPWVNAMPSMLIANLYRLWQRGNTVMTSSMGRLFDAVAVLIGLMEMTLYEGQAGRLIETAANRIDTKCRFHFTLPLIDGVWQTDALFSQMLTVLGQETLDQADLDQKAFNQINYELDCQAHIAKAFLEALATAVAALARQYPSLPIVLCGGVFQNNTLMSRTTQLLKEQGNTCLSAGLVPINDGGIALGQLWYAIHHQDSGILSTKQDHAFTLPIPSLNKGETSFTEL